MRILLWNATNIKNKTHELTLFLDNNQIPVAILTETWLKPSDHLHIPNYMIFRKDRLLDAGGVVAILIHKNVPTCTIPQTNLDIEYTAVKLSTPSPLVVVAAYIPPRKPIEPKILHKLTSLDPSSQFIIGGIFNARHMTCNNRRNNFNGITLKNFINRHLINVLYPDSSTYFRGKSTSIIDVFLTNITVSTKCSTRNNLSFSHLPVILEIDSTYPISFLKKYPSTDWTKYK